jgi:PTH1 family peptidyl-tRNA hydrolase
VGDGPSPASRPAVLVGLGNPGPRYRKTRHNLGFLLIERLEGQLGATPGTGRGDYLRTDTEVEGRPLVLVRPMTFMNLSGRAVVQLLDREGYEDPELLVAVDDVALPLGRIRTRAGGSHGGHNGLRSIQEDLGHTDYARMRLGCGPVPEDADLVDFVLDGFEDSETADVDGMLERAATAVRHWVVEGLEDTIARFNG